MSKYFDMLAYLMGKQAGGGGGDISVVSKSISSNGTYTAPAGKAYSPVTVDVPNSYAAGDEGKVVSNGELVAQGSDSVTQNGTVDTTLINSLLVNVSGGGGGLPSAYQEVEYIDSGNGGPYIVTDYTPVQYDEILADIWQNVRPSSENTFYCPFSAGSGTYQLIFLYGHSATSGKENLYFKYFSTGAAQDVQKYTYSNNKQSVDVIGGGNLIIDGQPLIQSSYEDALDGNATTLHVFVRANLSLAFPGKIGRLYILNGTETKLHLVPCYRKSDSVVGMYDMVSGTFYTNSGSGSFTAGSDVLSDVDALNVLLGGA